ncbi:MAG: DUF481 domain-containing protein [Planctomycetota bacterium]
MHQHALAASMAALCSLGVFANPVFAQEEAVEAVPASGTETAPGDYVELRNGDRISGTITAITPDGVAISSTALGDLVVPLGNIAGMRSSSPVSVALQGDAYEELTTPVLGFDGQQFRFGQAGAARTVPASQVVEPAVGVVWDASIAVGGSISFGNTERRSANVDARLTRRTEENRFTGRFNWNYAEADTEQAAPGAPLVTVTDVTQRTTFGSAQWDEFISECLFGYVNSSAEFDELANLRLRFIAGAGLGYQVVDSEEYSLAVEGGLAYVSEDNVDSPLGQPLSPPAPDPDAQYLAARASIKLDWDIIEDVHLSSQGEVFPSLEDNDNITARVDTRLQVTLTENLFAQFQWIFDYDNTPASGNERDDHLLTASIGWSL